MAATTAENGYAQKLQDMLKSECSDWLACTVWHDAQSDIWHTQAKIKTLLHPAFADKDGDAYIRMDLGQLKTDTATMPYLADMRHALQDMKRKLLEQLHTGHCLRDGKPFYFDDWKLLNDKGDVVLEKDPNSQWRP